LPFLRSFKAENDLIAFPRDFLPEKRFGYWIAAARWVLNRIGKLKRQLRANPPLGIWKSQQ